MLKGKYAPAPSARKAILIFKFNCFKVILTLNNSPECQSAALGSLRLSDLFILYNKLDVSVQAKAWYVSRH